MTATLVVGDDVDRSLLGAGCCAVDSDIVTDQVGLHVRPDAPVGLDQPTRPLVADLPVVEDLILVLRRVRIGLRNLLRKPLVQRLVLTLTDQ